MFTLVTTHQFCRLWHEYSQQHRRHHRSYRMPRQSSTKPKTVIWVRNCCSRWNKGLTYRVYPVAVELRALAAIQCDHPSSAVLVGFVLPHRPDVILEQRVVTPNLHLAGLLDVSEKTPEVFNSVERRHLILIILPRLVAIWFVVPQGPGVL